jgi:hypothetical protein
LLPFGTIGSFMARLRKAHEALKRAAAGKPLREIVLSYAVDHTTINRLRAYLRRIEVAQSVPRPYSGERPFQERA